MEIQDYEIGFQWLREKGGLSLLDPSTNPHRYFLKIRIGNADVLLDKEGFRSMYLAEELKSSAAFEEKMRRIFPSMEPVAIYAIGGLRPYQFAYDDYYMRRLPSRAETPQEFHKDYDKLQVEAKKLREYYNRIGSITHNIYVALESSTFPFPLPFDLTKEAIVTRIEREEAQQEISKKFQPMPYEEAEKEFFEFLLNVGVHRIFEKEITTPNEGSTIGIWDRGDQREHYNDTRRVNDKTMKLLFQIEADGGIHIVNSAYVMNEITKQHDTFRSQWNLEYQEVRSLLMQSTPTPFGELVEGKKTAIEQRNEDMAKAKGEIDSYFSRLHIAFNGLIVKYNSGTLQLPIDINKKQFIKAGETILSEQDIFALIANGESHELEFKSSANWDYRKEKPNKDLHKEIVKTVAGFLNADGGMLLIGVDNSKNIVGLEFDYTSLNKDRDGYEVWLMDLLLRALGNEISIFIRIFFYKIDGKELCRIECRSSAAPVLAKIDDSEHLYVRTGNSTRKLEAREIVNWVKLREKRF